MNTAENASKGAGMPLRHFAAQSSCCFCSNQAFHNNLGGSDSVGAVRRNNQGFASVEGESGWDSSGTGLTRERWRGGYSGFKNKNLSL